MNPDLKRVQVNGIILTIVTKEVALEYEMCHFFDLGDGVHVITSCLTKGDVMQAAGYQPGQFDFAVPEDWARKQHEAGQDPYEYVWLYPEGSLLGKPLQIEKALDKVREEIRYLMAEDMREVETRLKWQ